MIAILMATSLMAAATQEQRKLDCKEIQGYVRSYGRDMVISGARARGYSEKVIAAVVKKCRV